MGGLSYSDSQQISHNYANGLYDYWFALYPEMQISDSTTDTDEDGKPDLLEMLIGPDPYTSGVSSELTPTEYDRAWERAASIYTGNMAGRQQHFIKLAAARATLTTPKLAPEIISFATTPDGLAQIAWKGTDPTYRVLGSRDLDQWQLLADEVPMHNGIGQWAGKITLRDLYGLSSLGTGANYR